jgi:hypothetical protein
MMGGVAHVTAGLANRKKERKRGEGKNPLEVELSFLENRTSILREE